MDATLMTRGRFWAWVLALAAVAMVLVGSATQVKAAEVVDVNFKQLYFNYTSGVGFENIIGNGKNNGDQVLWKDLITVDGVTVDALVTTTLVGATMLKYGDGIAGVPGDFRVGVKSEVINGYAGFQFAFYKGGTYPTPSNPEATPEPLELENVQITAKDIDFNQFNSFVGARGYTTSLSPATALVIIKTPPDLAEWPADLKFQGPATGGVDLAIHQAVVSFATVEEADVLMGASTVSQSAFALTWKFAEFVGATTESEGQLATVTYNLNGGTGTTPEQVSGVFGEIKGTVATDLGFERADYDFDGWTTAPDGTGTPYTPAAVLTIPATNTTLYANWAGVYTITYNGNGADMGTAPANGSYTSGGSAYVIAGNTGSLERTGYIFAGWNTAADGTGITYAEDDTYSANANLALYALWTPDLTATLKVKVMSTGTEVTSGNPISEAYDGVEVELSADNGETWLYKPMQVTPASGEVDFGTVAPYTVYQVRLKAPCDSRPTQIWTDLDVTIGNTSLTRTLAATVPCAPVMSYNLALDELSWTAPNDGGSRIRYYTYWYNTPARITASQPWGIFARFWPANLLNVPFVTYGTTTATCPSKAVAPNDPAPYNTSPQCSRILGAPAVGTTFHWKVVARNALNTASEVTPIGVGWGQWSNTVVTNRQ